ncbi:PAS domain-containing protein [Rhodovibrionaceae bacterium A322]
MTSDDTSHFATTVRDIKSGPVSAASDLITAPAQELFDWWQSNQQPASPLYRSGTPPLRASFDILDHAGLAKNLFLIKRLAPGRYDYRIIGEDTRFLLGSRLAMNERVKLFVTGFTQSVPDYLDFVCDQACPQHTRGLRTWPDRQPAAFEGLDCPMVDHSGRISHIIGTVCSLDPDALLPSEDPA